MTKIATKQIDKLIGGYISLSVLITSGNNVNIYPILSTLDTSPFFNRKGFVITNSTGETVTGLVTNHPNNIVYVNVKSTNSKLYYNRKEVYGRLTYVSPTEYRVTFYYRNSFTGPETVYTITSTDIILKVPYRFKLENLPTDFALQIKNFHIGEYLEQQTSTGGGSGGTASDTWKSSVLSVETDPTSLTPSTNDSYIIGVGAINSWVGFDNKVATFTATGWVYIVPTDGYTLKIKSDDLALYQFSGTYNSGGTWVRQPFLIDLLGSPTNGDWSDGLYDFSAYKTVDAFQELSNFTKFLAPPSAPVLSDYSEATVSKFVGKMSYDTAHPLSGYAPADATGIVPPISSDKIFPISGKRLGVTTRFGNSLSGILNYQVSQNGSTPTPAYDAHSFGNADKGNLVLLVNNTPISILILTNTNNAIDSTAGGTRSGIAVSAIKPSYFPLGGEFSLFKNRTGTWMIVKTDLQSGYNNIKIVHAVSLTNVITLDSFEIIIDGDQTATTYTGLSSHNISLSGVKYLSGVGFYTSGTFQIDATVNNVYKNTYYTGNDAITYSGIGVTTLQEALENSNGDTTKQVIITNKTLTINSTQLLNGTLSPIISAKRSVQPLVSSPSIPITNILLDNKSDDSTDTIENFNSESHRLISNLNSDIIPVSPHNSWDSQYSINDGGTGYNDALQVLGSKLIYPGKYSLYPSDFRTTTITNSPSWNNGGTKGTSRNYSSLSGNRVYLRYFYKSISLGTTSLFKINLQGSSVVFVNTETSLTGNNVHLEIKAPSQTGWMDAYKDYISGQYLDTNGCRYSTNGAGRTLNLDWGLSIGTNNTANTGGYMLVRITTGSNFSGYLNNITFSFI